MTFIQLIVQGFKYTFFVFVFLICSHLALAQPKYPGGRGEGKMGEMSGRIYGKVLDSLTNKPLEYAVIRVVTASGQLVSGALSEHNGDFSVDKVFVAKPLILEIGLVGYHTQKLKFELSPGGFPIEKDMGNIKLGLKEQKILDVRDDANGFRKEFDKSIYEVDKNAINAGGTAEDVLRNIPVVQVDQDGNVSVRNTAPQIFVDGRPTTLSIDQIPADAIEKVEVITNPSAKYDASGGGGGILNIVMKKDRGRGYNGSIRTGINTVPPNVETRLQDKYRMNGGIDFNVRKKKVNYFVNGNLNQRRSISQAYTDRKDLLTLPLQSDQYQISRNNGYFARGNVGLDWFIDNRNTITISESVNRGQFNPDDSMHVDVDTLNGATNLNGEYYRRSNTNRVFQNLGTSVLYKHLFAKEGTELTADLNYNAIQSTFDGDYKNIYSDSDPSIWRQQGSVQQSLYTFQMDYVTKLNDRYKLELGRRFSLRNYGSNYDNFRYDLNTGNYTVNPSLLVDYSFSDRVEAMYSTLSVNGEKWKYQMGLRAESSSYTGELKSTGNRFKIDYPISLFPSFYITRVIDPTQDFQLSFNRRINRPGFMQLSPFTDYSDSLNVSRGNPNLKPEFTHGVEFSYLKNFSKKNTLVASLYSRYTTNVTVKQQITEYSDVLNDNIIVTTSMNAFYGWASGMELVSRNAVTEWFDLTTTLNIYNSTIDGTNITPDLTNSINSFWVKMNTSFKLPKGLIIQVNGDYASKKALEVGSSERGGGMGGGGGFGGGHGGGMGGGTLNTAQGFVRPNYGLDCSIKKEFLKDRSLVVSIAAQDVFHTRVTSVYSKTPYFLQDAQRYRDWQTYRVNVSWRFGKMDASLFKRKNNKTNSEGMEG
jgi:outer membrane receptor protein involved in Fe transport